MDKILCIGEALIDMICTDKGKSLADGENYLKKTGGAPTNVAAAIGALGGKVSLAAKVGTDPFGKQLVQAMQQFGVDTAYMLQAPNHFTTMAYVSLMHNGERDFIFSRGADGQLTEAEVNAITITNYPIVHFGSATAFLQGPLQQAYNSLLTKAISNNCFISFDPNYRHLLFVGNTAGFIAKSWHYMQYCNFYKLSDEEALLITQTTTIQQAIAQLHQRTTAIFAVTIGEQGTLLGYKGTTITVPSINITPVDTTGAGDAFVGAILFQLSKHSLTQINNLSMQNWEAIIINANKAGARTCQYYGAMEAYKNLNSSIFN